MPAGATRVVLVRHGEAVCNVSGVVGGMRGCTGLTDRGVDQVLALRDRLARTGEVRGAAVLYASTLPRAVQTAEIVAPALAAAVEAAAPKAAGPGAGPGVELRLDPDLCELRPGEADGLTWAEFSARFEEPDWDARPDQPIAPGGESWSGFVIRASEALRRIAERAAGEQAAGERAAGGPDPDGPSAGPVVVVCHAGVIEASLLRFLPVHPAVPRLRLRTAHASLTEWRVAGGAWTLERYNDGAAGG